MKKMLLIALLSTCCSAFAQEVIPVTDSLKKDSINAEKQLKEVMINVRKKAIERKIDRTIVDVGSFETASGSDALDFLGRLPGLRVTDDGGINLMGKGASVYIDGRQTYLSGKDLVAYLKSLPTDLLDKIELMPHPPAKYEAAGSGGLINIITRKNKQQGYNAGITANGGTGVYRKLNASANMNYRIGKLNLFANMGAGSPKEFENASSLRRFLNPQGTPTSMVDQQSEITYLRRTANLKLGSDYYLNKRTTLGFIFSGAQNSQQERGENQNRALNTTWGLDSTILSGNNVDQKFRSRQMNLNMSHQFDSLGSEMSMDLDYGTYRTRSEQAFNNLSYDALGITNRSLIRGDLPRDIRIYAAKTDFVIPLKGGFKLSTGLKLSKVKTDNTADYLTGEGLSAEKDLNKSNRFLYDETIGGAYVESYKEFGRFGVQAGMRLEQTKSQGRQLGNELVADSSFNRKYLNTFPGLFISFKPDSTNRNQFFLAYGRRINRPAYDRLNPFLSLVQRYNQVAGNPFLKPDFTNNMELTHVFKEQFNTNIYFTTLNNVSSEVIRPSGDVYVKRPENTGSVRITGVMLTYNRDLFKWWNSDFSFNPERVSFNLELNNKRVDTTFYAHSFNWFNRFTVNKNLTAELVMNTSGRSFSGQSTSKGIATFRAGIRQQLFKGNGSIGINGNDLLYKAKTRGKILNVSGSDAVFENRRDTRTILVSFSYRMSKNAKDNKRQRDRNGVREEQSRVESKP